MDPELLEAINELQRSWKDFRRNTDEKQGTLAADLLALQAQVNRMNLGGAFGASTEEVSKLSQKLAVGLSGLSAGKMIRGMITGKWTDADNEFRAMSEGTLAGGGALVPALLSAELIDAARNRMVLSAAGARVVSMDSQSLAFPRVDTAASASWVAENAAAPETTITLGSGTLRARKVISMIRASMELAADAPNFAAMVEDQLTKATALAFDYAGLCGSGVGENPMGIETTPGIGTADVNGAITVDLLLDAYYALLAANVPEDAITCVMNTGVAKNLAKLKYTEVGGATNAYLAGITWPEALKKVRFLVSNQIPSVSSKATVLMGDFSQLFMGVRLGGQLNISNSASIGGESTFERSQLGISYLQRGDFIVSSPSSFYSLTRVNA